MLAANRDSMVEDVTPRNYYLSIDCATRSLAIGMYSSVSDIRSKWAVIDDASIDSLIQIHWIKLIDVTDGKTAKSVDAFTKARSLKQHMREIVELMNQTAKDEKPTLLIEYQMNANDKSRAVYNQLVYEFCDLCDIVCMPPALKNTVYLNKALRYGEVLNVSGANYQANKNHSKYNFMYYLCVTKQLHLLKGVKSKNYDDIADTFMQMVAHLVRAKDLH